MGLDLNLLVNCFLHLNICFLHPIKERKCLTYPWGFICKGKRIFSGSHCTVLMEVLQRSSPFEVCALWEASLVFFSFGCFLAVWDKYCSDLWRFFEGGCWSCRRYDCRFFFHFWKGDSEKITKFHFWKLFFLNFVVVFQNDFSETCFRKLHSKTQIKLYSTTDFCKFWNTNFGSHFYAFKIHFRSHFYTSKIHSRCQIFTPRTGLVF